MKAAKHKLFLSQKSEVVISSMYIVTLAFSLGWLFNNAISTETVESDGRMSNECGAVGGMKNWQGK
jgi:hypothetical protein